jgi:membrane protease subunit HflK
MTSGFDSTASATASVSERVLPAGPPPPAAPGPIAQSVAIGFRSVYAVAALLLVLWLSGNIREIAPDSQAVVRRFGDVVRTQDSGLLIAWPRPIEQVQILPGREQQLSQQVSALEPPTQESQALIGPAAGGGSLPPDESAYLTGDGNVVLLNATLIYHISNPIAYALSERHVAPALGRLFRATTVQVAAGRYLNDFLVVNNAALQRATRRGDRSALGGVVAVRAEVREALLRELNARLRVLAGDGAALGVTVDRIDMTAWLPAEAKVAFDQVLLAAQTADREVADARTEAERRRQGGTQLSERLIASAQARAQEMLSDASVRTAAIVALEHVETPTTRESLLMQRYRHDVSEIMKRVGTVRLVDPRTGARFVIPGDVPRSAAASGGGNP